MNQAARIAFRTTACALRLYQRVFMDFHLYGRALIPPGPKIYVCNHITTTDPYWMLPAVAEPVHIVVGPAYHSKAAAWVLDRLGQINATPEHRSTAVAHAVDLLRRGESVLVAPEGDIQPTFQLGRFYPGAARMYRQTEVPIIPMALHAPRPNMWRCRWLDMQVEGRTYRGLLAMQGLYCINIGEPMFPPVSDTGGPDEDAAIMDAIKSRIRSLIDDICTNKHPGIRWR